MRITAAVVNERSGPFVIEELDLTDPRDDELLVEVAASGMCATDLHGRDGYYTIPYPAVFGHEGAGIVRAAGAGVTEFKAGDHVLMAYPWCGECPNCRAQLQTYCMHSGPLKHGGTRTDGTTLHEKNGKPVYGAFFQQSSFANYTIANQRFTVKLRRDAPLEVVCALACGGQTGAGAVFNVMQPKPGDAFAVFGVGTVGLSGLMAAKIAGCDPIIAVDVHESRLALARELGATHTINHAARNDVVSDTRKITGHGVRFSLETSAGGHLRLAWQRARRDRGQLRDTVPAERPRGARRRPGRQRAEAIHPSLGRSSDDRTLRGRSADHKLRFCRHQPRRSGASVGPGDQARAADAALVTD
jgi:aryl-alcohol dehydrogenase